MLREYTARRNCSGNCYLQCADDCNDTCWVDCGTGCGGCSDGCGGCDYGCSGGCGQSCMYECVDSCVGNCGYNCTGTCDGGCNGCSGCTSCTGTCTGGCTSCNGCTGSCEGNCNTGCLGCTSSCQGECNTACTATGEAETIANLGGNIKHGNIIKAVDYTTIKAAIDKEYRRRGKPVPSAFVTPPTSGKPVTMEVTQKVLTDIYQLDYSSTHNWTSEFNANENVPPSKWEPIIAHVKALMSETIPRK